MTSIDQFFEEKLSTTIGQPLRVAVYSRIARGIRDGIFALGSALPRETELGAALGVSRTVVREALMLLEEDGLVVTRRGVGRFVAASTPRVGLEELRPFELALADLPSGAASGTAASGTEADAAGAETGPGGQAGISVHPITFTMQPNTEFVAANLHLDAEANTWFNESLLRRDGEPVAIVQEHLPAGRYLSDISQAIAAHLDEAAGGEATVLARLLELCGPIFSAASCQIAPSVVGASRGKLLGLKASDPVMILTQVLEVEGTPAYLAKCVVSSRLGHLTVMQTPPS